MNKLNNQKVYLAGAMDRVPDRGVAWRDSITPFLESLNVVVFNPLKKPLEIGLETDDAHALKTKFKAPPPPPYTSNCRANWRTFSPP